MTVLYEKQRGGEGEREQVEVLLQHIQIYPGNVLPNMQDLFMSVSISASHLQTESAASTPQRSQAYNTRHIYKEGRLYCLWSYSLLLTQIIWLDYALNRISTSEAKRH